MEVTDLGIDNETRLLQWEKATRPISSIESGRVMVIKFEHPLKAVSAILFPFNISTDWRFWGMLEPKTVPKDDELSIDVPIKGRIIEVQFSHP